MSNGSTVGAGHFDHQAISRQLAARCCPASGWCAPSYSKRVIGPGGAIPTVIPDVQNAYDLSPAI
jgi:hypothetical protein